MRSERRAARVAQEKIAESAKYLASNKIMATTSPPPPVKRRNRKGAGKKVAATAAAPATTVAISTPSKIAFVTVPPQIRMSTAGFKTAPIVRTNAATSLPIAIRPQMLAGQTLPKMPILVFNSLGSNMPTLIPISASSLAPNTIVTLAPGGGSSSVSGIRRAFTTTTTTTTSAIKTMQPVTLKSPVVTCKQAAPSNVISNKFLRYNNTTRHTISLTMECEEETLSSAQWLKYRKAESEYIDVLRKLTRWKGRSDVEIVNLGPDDPIPPLPRFLNVQEASRLVISDKLESTDCNVFDDDVIIEMETMSADQSSALTPVIQFEDPKEKSVTNPRVNVVMIPPSQTQSKVLTSSASETASTSSVAPVRRPSISGLTVFRPKTVAAVSTTSTTGGKPKDSANEPVGKKVSLSAELLVKMNLQKLVSNASLTAKQQKLDAFLNELMQSSDVNVDRWMVEKGLFGVSRICLFHPRMQMKLVFFTNSKDSNNGGGGEGTYKWFCNDCSIMLPVDQGSFFSKWDRTHRTILRVIYHWAYNTDVARVIREVGVDKEFVHSVYAAIRAVCAKHSVRWRIGGAGHVVEVAKVALGICKDVMDVSLFCAYDKRTRHVKLGASTPTFLKMKMAALYRVMVDKNSYVVGDQSLAPYFPAHFKDNFSFSSNHPVNPNAISYLKQHALPTVSNLRAELKLESIQRILNELAWRERFGRNPLDAYNNILTHIKQSFISSVITTRSAKSVSIASPSELKVVDTSKLDNSAASLTTLTPVSDTPLSSRQSPSRQVDDAKVTVSSLVQEQLITEDPETIIVDCDLAGVSIEVKEDAVEKPTTNSKRGASLDESKDKSPKAKKLKSSDLPGMEYIKVSDWMPPMGVQLESYYYGIKEGHHVPSSPPPVITPTDGDQAETEPTTATAVTIKYKFKCHACKRSLEDNTKTMKHLNGHINALKQFNLDLSDLTNCKYCFREFESPYAMQTHVEEVHVGEQSKSPVCRICDKEFADVASFCHHMKTSHVQSELPYKCLVCKFRTSFYRDIIAHFREMHGGTDKLLCIHCLRVFTVKFGPGIQEGLTYGFYRHVYKHQSKSVNRRCPTCCLSFLSGTELQQHRNSDHCSFAKQNGVKPSTPSNKSKPIYIMPSTKYQQHREGGNKKHPKLLCMECKLSVHTAEHFLNSLSCSSCSYVTCCGRAFNAHVVTLQCGPPQLRPKSVPFPAAASEMSCGCNHVSTNGDKMAKHLSKCGRKWCYFTGDTDSDSGGAKANQHESDDDDDDAGSLESTLTISNDDQHNMMNVLGLMRVSPRRRQRSKSTTASENSA